MHPNVYRAELLTHRPGARRAVHRAPKAARDGSPYFGPMVLLTFQNQTVLSNTCVITRPVASHARHLLLL